METRNRNDGGCAVWPRGACIAAPLARLSVEMAGSAQRACVRCGPLASSIGSGEHDPCATARDNDGCPPAICIGSDVYGAIVFQLDRPVAVCRLGCSRSDRWYRGNVKLAKP